MLPFLHLQGKKKGKYEEDPRKNETKEEGEKRKGKQLYYCRHDFQTLFSLSWFSIFC